MTTEIERRVGNLLDSSQSQASVSASSSLEVSAQRTKQLSDDGDITQPVSALEIDSTKEKLSLELKEKQDKMKVHIPIWSF